MAKITEKLSNKILTLPGTPMSLNLLNQDSFIRYDQTHLFDINDRDIEPINIYRGEKILSLDYISRDLGELKTYVITPNERNESGEKRVSHIIRGGEYYFNEVELRQREESESDDIRVATITYDSTAKYKAFCVLDGTSKKIENSLTVSFPDGFKINNGTVQPDRTGGVARFTIRASFELLGAIVDIAILKAWMSDNNIEKIVIAGASISKTSDQDQFIIIKNNYFEVQYFTSSDLSTSFDISYLSLQTRSKRGIFPEKKSVSVILMSYSLDIPTEDVLYHIDRAATHYFREGLTEEGLLSPSLRIKNILSGGDYLVNRTLSNIYDSLLTGGASNPFISSAAESLSLESGRFEKNNISDVLSGNYITEYRNPKTSYIQLDYIIPESEGSEVYRYEDEDVLDTNDSRPITRRKNIQGGGGCFNYSMINSASSEQTPSSLESSPTTDDKNDLDYGVLSSLVYNAGFFTIWLADILPGESIFEETSKLTDGQYDVNGVFVYIPEIVKDSIIVELFRKEDDGGITLEPVSDSDFKVIGNVMRLSAPNGIGNIYSIRVKARSYSVSKAVVVAPPIEKGYYSGNLGYLSTMLEAHYIEGQNLFRVPINDVVGQKFNIPLFTTGFKISKTYQKDFAKRVFFNTSATLDMWDDIRKLYEDGGVHGDVLGNRRYTLYNGHPHVRIAVTLTTNVVWYYYAMLFMDMSDNQIAGRELLTWEKGVSKVYDDELNETDLSIFYQRINLSKIILDPVSCLLSIECDGKGSNVSSVDMAIGGHLVPWNNRDQQYRYNEPYQPVIKNGLTSYSRDVEVKLRSGHDGNHYSVVSEYDLQDKKVLPHYKQSNIISVKNLNYQHKKIIDLTHCNDHVYLDIEVTYKDAMREFSSISESISRVIFAMKEHRFWGSFKKTLFIPNMNMRKNKKVELYVGFPVVFVNNSQIKEKDIDDFVDIVVNIRQKPRRRQRF